ncbi:MAG: Holliday junction resolvase RuvX [Microbacteriaceae bacterium]|nr:Holliday junction resolvase RuvX [Microbacteriaceae bacterium]
MSFRQGIRLGIDVGRARVGLARSDPEGLLCVPIKTLVRSNENFKELTELFLEYDAIEFVVGVPYSLDGTRSKSTEDSIEFAQELAKASGKPVRLVDERLSTVQAQSRLRDAGKDSKSARGVIDQVAATIILQNALETEQNTGQPPGSLSV